MYDFNLTGHYQTERAGWMKEVNFSLSYEQLTRIAEERIRECNLDSQGAITSARPGRCRAELLV
jgi:hypothetical protein